ncbi:MAG: hypothetical protein ACM34J_00850 [Ignavibacteria bacterium]
MLKRSLQFSGYLLILFSLGFSCSSKETNKDNNSPPRSSEDAISIPPNTADVEAEILNSYVRNSNNVCRLKIKEVFEYGAYVNPLPPGTEIEALLSEELLEKESKKIENGEEVFVRISQTSGPQAKDYWVIIMFNK